MGGGLAPEVRQALGPLDRLAREQYLDFVHFRRYRESLLCHAGALSRFVVQPPRALGMHVLPSLTLRRAADDAGTATERRRRCRGPQAIAAGALAPFRAGGRAC